MKVIMLSWEFPPKAVGGIAPHVHDLTASLTSLGEEIHLVTCGDQGMKEFENVNGVHVYRVFPYHLPANDFVAWVMQLNMAILEKAISLLNELEWVNIIHAHDWLVAYAARVLKHAYHIPLIATIHATEYGRNHGLHNNIQRYISSVEWWQAYEAWRVICCSKFMKSEVRFVFQTPDDKIRVIVNGVTPERFNIKKVRAERSMYAAADEQIVFYVGRLVREKGVQVLLDAIPRVIEQRPRTKFVIAGKGPYEMELRSQANLLGISHRVYFTGYIDDEVRNCLYNWADIAVFPSLYEPFGIVALEGMAAKTPVVVSDTGGLSEIIEHGFDGLLVNPGDKGSLAEAIMLLLQDAQLREKLRFNAFRKVQKEFNWQQIASQTRQVYQEVFNEYRNTPWHEETGQPRHFLGRVSSLLARA